MTHPRIAPVNVVAPTTPEPDWAHELTVAALTDLRRIVVHARPGQRRPRTADLAADLLDALGRPGVAIAVRKNLSSDLTRVVPFLLTDNVTDFVVLRPEDLGRDACEDVIAVAMLAHLRLWLVLGSEPTGDLADLLAAYSPIRWTTQQATEAWTAGSPRRQRRGATPRALGAQLTLNQVSSDEARDRLARLADAVDPASAAQLADAHGRDTLRPALQAIADVPTIDTDRLGRIKVAAVCPRGASLEVGGKAVAVPPAARRALVRQRLHALVVGQRTGDPIFTLDGTAMANSTLASLATRRRLSTAPALGMPTTASARRLP